MVMPLCLPYRIVLWHTSRMSIDKFSATEKDKSGDLAQAVATPESEPEDDDKRAEIGGRDGPDPTRFGDWEKNGRCIDF